MPIRVLMLAENPYMGGITSHILTALQALKDDSEICLVPATLPGLHGDNTLVEAAEQAGFHVHTFAMAHRFDFRVLKELRRYVQDEAIDVVHVHGYRGAVVAALAGLAAPVVSTCHGELVAPALRSRVWEQLSLWAMRRHVRVIACAQFVRDWLLREGLSPTRVAVIPNATLPPAAPHEENVRQRMHLAPGRLLVVFAGRLAEGKGLPVLLDALQDLPDVAAAIVGDGELAQTLRQQAAPMADRVWLAGRRNHVGDFFEAADVVVLPSQQEALPMTLIEAASWGKPVLATRVGGIPEIVVDEDTGLLVQYGDVDALKTALARLADAPLRERLGENARTRWERCFSPVTLAGALREVYRQAVS